jgi:hypothetical protein
MRLSPYGGLAILSVVTAFVLIDAGIKRLRAA